MARRLTLVWGVRSRHSSDSDDSDGSEAMVERATRAAAAEQLLRPSQPLVVVAGVPFGTPGSTNLLRVVWP